MKKDTRNARIVILYTFILVATLFLPFAMNVEAQTLVTQTQNFDAYSVGDTPHLGFSCVTSESFGSMRVLDNFSHTHPNSFGEVGYSTCSYYFDNSTNKGRTISISFAVSGPDKVSGSTSLTLFYLKNGTRRIIDTYFSFGTTDFLIGFSNGTGTSFSPLSSSYPSHTWITCVMTIDFAAGTYNVTVNGTLLGYAHRLFRTPNDRCTAMYFIGNDGADNHPVCIDDISMTFYVRNWSTKTSGYNTFGSLSPLHSPSLIIDAGAAKTTDPNMTLAFSCTNATSMNLSLDNSTWLPGMNYTASGYYDVGTTCGNITIYVRYYNASTGDYAYAHDDILFTFNSTITIIGYNETSQGWDDPVETNALTVLLNISSPNASWMEFGYTSDTGPFDVGPLAYNTSLYYTLPCTMNGGVLVYARFTIPINGTDYYEYVNDTINMNGSVPNLTITYPVEGAT